MKGRVFQNSELEFSFKWLAGDDARELEVIALYWCQERREEGSVLGREPHPGADAELPFEDGDLVAQGEDLDVLVSPIGSSHSAAKAFVTVR
jgi:hypothetical protein